jgi:hypothetical protein
VTLVISLVVVLPGIVSIGVGIYAAIARDWRWSMLALGLSMVTVAAGIAGTAIGMDLAFDVVAHVDPAKKAVVLADAISDAMTSTLTGLIVGGLAFVVGLIAFLRSPFPPKRAKASTGS